MTRHRGSGPFRLDPLDFRRLGRRAVDMAADHLIALPSGPVYGPMDPRERAELLNQVMPDEGFSADEILDLIGERLLPHPMGNGHPRFFGWVNSAPSQLAVITELLAAALNPSCAGGDHAAIYLERCVIRWLMELVEFPTSRAMGILVSGGSMASLVGLTVARQWASRVDGWDVRARGLQDDRPRLVLYASTEGHSCLRKSAEMLGLGHDSVRTIPVDEHYRMDVRALEETVQRDKAEGLRPFCVVATAGTVNSGSVDPIGAMVEV